ncbi:MAG: ribonuclease H family protein [Clostridium sp.]|jgi:ribonuclease HI|nr:ribonuclease H family protein [Clostridium sp.]
MAAKKYYAVRKGKATGIFPSWKACRETVEGFPGAEFQGFPDLAEAERYLGLGGAVPAQDAQEGRLVVYVDGSYSHALKRYAFSCVFLLPDGRIFTENGNGNQPDSLLLRNVTGEMLGAMFAVRFAIVNGFGWVEIRYDYEGIEKWATGAWRSKTELTRKYAAAMRNWGSQVKISFQKVAAHANVYYNEVADRLAKEALKAGNGIPRARKIEEMEPWDGDQDQ